MVVEYTYAQGDLIENPQNYAYSDYFGESFLAAWLRNREEQLAKLPAAQKPLQFDNESFDPVDTLSLLNAICGSLSSPHLQANDKANYWLKRLLKKFEVTKRVYSAYSPAPPHKPLGASSYTQLNLYIKLAECFVVAFEKDDALQYLNGFLKMQDSLISQSELLDKISQSNLAWLIHKEMKTIQKLMVSKELT